MVPGRARECVDSDVKLLILVEMCSCRDWRTGLSARSRPGSINYGSLVLPLSSGLRVDFGLHEDCSGCGYLWLA